MIILNGGGEAWGLPELSPYVTKTEVHLRMAGLAYEKRRCNPDQSPKGQMPFIDDGGRLIADSTFIRFHIEREYGVDLDEGLTALERATSLTIETMVDHTLTAALAWFRWLVPENFARGPAQFFASVPADMRDAVCAGVVAQVAANLKARGIGRHTPDEILALGARTLSALEVFIGDSGYVMGEKPCGADALVFAALAGVMTPHFPSPLRDEAIRRPRLVAYVSRMMDRYYPEFEWDAGIGVERKAA
jgi:glutathione S-transferase